MTDQRKSNLIQLFIICAMISAFLISVGYSIHPVFFVLACAVIAFWLIMATGETDWMEKNGGVVMGTLALLFFVGIFGSLFFRSHSNNHYVATALMDRSFPSCFAEKGDLDACINESVALTGRDKRFVVAFNNWGAVYPACKEKLGVDLCVRELDKFGVDLKTLVKAEDVNSLCPLEGRRTECLFSLVDSGFPLAKLVLDRGKS